MDIRYKFFISIQTRVKVMNDRLNKQITSNVQNSLRNALAHLRKSYVATIRFAPQTSFILSVSSCVYLDDLLCDRCMIFYGVISH